MDNSRAVSSNQTERHPDLLVKLLNHLNTDYQRPIPDVAEKIFADTKATIAEIERPLIFDSGCGVGQSTEILARLHPNHWVIGIDQSEHRLTKQRKNPLPENMLLIRANCVDFWRLALADGWKLDKHYLLFPNPWPKKHHLQRRWHGHPVFPDMINLKGQLELRTNWHMYAWEMQTALEYMNYPTSEVETYLPEAEYLTPFEKKYHESGQTLYRLTADLS